LPVIYVNDVRFGRYLCPCTDELAQQACHQALAATKSTIIGTTSLRKREPLNTP